MPQDPRQLRGRHSESTWWHRGTPRRSGPGAVTTAPHTDHHACLAQHGTCIVSKQIELASSCRTRPHYHPTTLNIRRCHICPRYTATGLELLAVLRVGVVAARLLDATKQASFKASCRRQFREFGALLLDMSGRAPSFNARQSKADPLMSRIWALQGALQSALNERHFQHRRVPRNARRTLRSARTSSASPPRTPGSAGP